MARLVSFLRAMEFVYEQSSGCLYLRDTEDVLALIGCGYSGKGESQNAPEHEDRAGYGPVPRGVWKLAPPIQHPTLGPVAIRLHPQTYKGARSAFLIHGDNARGDGSASRGCIILGRDVRDFIAKSGITRLVVERGPG